MLLDILLIVEIAWCMVLIGQKTMERTLLYLGGLISAGYVASISSSWATQVLVGRNNAAMTWIAGQIKAPAQPVGLLATVLPPTSAIGGHGINSEWIALHVATAILVFLMTISVYALFVVVSQLAFALWDSPDVQTTGTNRKISYLLGLGGGVYIAFLTGTALANLSWLRSFSILSDAVGHSILLSFASTLISMAQFYGIHLIG